MWHVSSRSGVTTLRTAIHLLLTYLLLYMPIKTVASASEYRPWRGSAYIATALSISLHVTFTRSPSLVASASAAAAAGLQHHHRITGMQRFGGCRTSNLTNKNFYVLYVHINFRDREINKNTSRKHACTVVN